MREGAKEPQKKKGGALQAVFNVFGVLLCLIFIPIIILNIMMIVRSYTDPDKIPSAFGFSPVIVLSGSMSPEFEAGDMIFIRETDPYTLKVGDVICYMEEESAVTHRIIEVQQQDGSPVYITQGDANNAEDATPVTPEQIQGKYTGTSIAGAGNAALYLQSTPGMLIFIGGPVLLFLLWDILRRVVLERKNKKEQLQMKAESAGKQQEMEEMEKELQRLRAQMNGNGDQAPPPEKPE